jgi:hypothetical protein
MPALSQLNTLWQAHGEAARIVIGTGLLLSVPSVRDACGRALERPDICKLVDEATARGFDRVSEFLRQGGTPPELTG